MIKFFRKIRQRLLTENKFSKYLIYAIGEIVLVVIGILIALSINKYNEDIKAKKFELKLLKQIEKDLLENKDEYERLWGSYKRQLYSCEYIIHHIKSKLPLTDSLGHHFLSTKSRTIFSPINTSYAFLKTSGLNEIKNDSLRIAITKFHEQDIILLGIQLDRLLAIQSNQLEPFLIEHFKVKEYEKENEFSNYKTHFSPAVLPINYDNLILNEAYANIIGFKIDRLKINLRYLKGCQENLEVLITQLQKEIDST